MSSDPSPVAAVRSFNRFYTRQIGLLHEGLLRTRYSLAESRVLYELANRERPVATDLGKHLGIDPGYLSRILQRFRKSGLVTSRPSESDGRQSLLALTKKGRAEFTALDRASQEEVSGILGKLSAADQLRCVAAMRTVEALLSGAAPNREYKIRERQPGDMGWIVSLHGSIYAREYGWSDEFEAFVAEIAAQFIRRYDPEWERCWMAELDGQIVGSVVVVRQSKRVAKLRLLLVHPHARGLGIGARLVQEVIEFARQKGYRELTLWTNSVLHSARRIYEAAGFRCAGQEQRHTFGQDLTFETWTRKLP